MNFITLKELKKMVPVASEFKRVPGLKKILEDGIEVILRKQMENHAEVVVYKNGYVSYHAHERYTVFALHNCTHYYYESQGNEHQTIPHNHFEDMEWHIRLVLEGEDRLVRNLEARESETFSYAADVNPEYNNEMEDPRINVMDFVLNKEFLRKASELLKKHQWEMICRHYIEGMTHREIAAEMGVSHQYVTKGIQGEKRSMNTPNIFDRLSRKIHHHSDMEPHESDSGPPFDEVEPLNFQDEESVVHTVLEDFYAVGTLADELTDGFHMEAHGYLDREEVNARLIAFARKLEQVLDKWETHAALIA